ncbi:hypothetical protein FEM48_Zijuj01G0007700 [Ziziphus jujuba var. spinosa]|uniref:Cotton fiber protein n=1 Tax=Ziziphus jujuba var. spinosa TaxID=714518 RepID=A0A978VY61_ZIZJJ|nr:hypothetical protein FEM48_Zijuj01G0007700 [Ziziphus jujuba var. spinosa]
MASDNSSSLLSRLRRAVAKVKVLLNYNIYRWHVASMMGRSSLRSKRLSFNDRPGLRAASSDFEDDSAADSHQDSGSSSGSLQRTMSYPSDQDYDIDQRAEMFINNFRRQLQIERQVSLELRYFRGNSFEGKSP